jgi:hypothetical protein
MWVTTASPKAVGAAERNSHSCLIAVGHFVWLLCGPASIALNLTGTRKTHRPAMKVLRVRRGFLGRNLWLYSLIFPTLLVFIPLHRCNSKWYLLHIFYDKKDRILHILCVVLTYRLVRSCYDGVGGNGLFLLHRNAWRVEFLAGCWPDRTSFKPGACTTHKDFYLKSRTGETPREK